eukprot:NODE_7248_length_1596_cov_3.906059.p2 GENE.NODE_7248_length_1596_cov_3.906059~~NODE_7248_length_1596_cov_3.906059.p2  ORF type:complete len:304 (-),score=81.61 NODE_7248_length_1596_cov_3.906059:685-1491(-)
MTLHVDLVELLRESTECANKARGHVASELSKEVIARHAAVAAEGVQRDELGKNVREELHQAANELSLSLEARSAAVERHIDSLHEHLQELSRVVVARGGSHIDSVGAGSSGIGGAAGGGGSAGGAGGGVGGSCTAISDRRGAAAMQRWHGEQHAGHNAPLADPASQPPRVAAAPALRQPDPRIVHMSGLPPADAAGEAGRVLNSAVAAVDGEAWFVARRARKVLDQQPRWRGRWWQGRPCHQPHHRRWLEGQGARRQSCQQRWWQRQQ